MTRQYRDTERPATPFSEWIRALPYPLNSQNYDAQNLDYIWFHYRQGWFITIEEKRFGSQSQKAQQDTHNIITQLLTLASGQRVNTLRGKRPIIYKGHYRLSFERTTPDDSQWIRINEQLFYNPREIVLCLLSKGAINGN